MCPQTPIKISANSPIDDQIRYLEDFLTELEPDSGPLPAPIETEAKRVTDLRQAKAHIDKAIDLLRPHFPDGGVA